MLSEKLIQEIEKGMGLTGLKEAWESTDIVELEPTKVKHFTEAEHRQLVTNIQSDVPKEKWEEAKKAGEEMPIKELKKELGLEFEGKNAKALYDYMAKQIELSKETNTDKLRTEYESDISQLKKLLSDKDNEIKQINKSVKENTINSQIDNYFNTLQIEAPSHLKDEKQITDYIKLERDKNKTFFKNQYQFDIDEYNNIIASKDGQILKDETLNPIRVDNLIKDYADKSFMSLKQSIKGRGEGDRLPVREAKFNTKDDVEAYAKKKGIKKHTSQYDALLLEFNKQNT